MPEDINDRYTTSLPATRGGALARLRAILSRRLWLPRFVYEALPWIYTVVGCAALLSALYGSDENWHVPYVILLGLFALHAGIGIATLRYKFRQRREAQASADTDADADATPASPQH